MNIWKNGMLQKCLTEMYPKIVQPIVTPYLWKLNDETIDSMYQTHTGEKHLEIGGGPNPHMHKKDSEVHFMDVNHAVLFDTKRNYNHPSFEVHYGSLLYEDDYPKATYNSIACMNVMHCVPEPNKWNKLLYNTKMVLEDGGILFGCYVKNNTPYSKVLNKMGIFHNIHDSLEVVNVMSKEYYNKIQCISVGNCDVFVLKKKKQRQ